MIIDKIFLIEKFNLFNKMFFHNELPSIEIKISRTRNSFGQYMSKRHLVGKVVKSETPMMIKISNFWDRSEKEYCETLIHEMIHYYLSFKNIGRNEDSHGKHFKRMMNSINNSSNYNISVTSQLRNANTTKEITSTLVFFKYKENTFFSRISKKLKDKSLLEEKFYGISVIKFFETNSSEVAKLKMGVKTLSLIEASKENLTRFRIAS